jgi:glutathione S-transferase
MFFEQYSHEPYVAVLEFWTYWDDLSRMREDEQARLRQRGQQALDAMPTQLAMRDFFVGKRHSVADIALFAYTQSAAAIGFSVATPVERWLARVRAQPRYRPIKRDPLGKRGLLVVGGAPAHLTT